jgi:hypothetical protein
MHHDVLDRHVVALPRIGDHTVAQPGRPILGLGGDHHVVGTELAHRLVQRNERPVVAQLALDREPARLQLVEGQVEPTLGSLGGACQTKAAPSLSA